MSIIMSLEIIKMIKKAGDWTKVTKLVLDGILIKSFDRRIQRTLERLSNLKILSMNSCALESLKGFPKLE
jgi:hypothetical protein